MYVCIYICMYVCMYVCALSMLPTPTSLQKEKLIVCISSQPCAVHTYIHPCIYALTRSHARIGIHPASPAQKKKKSCFFSLPFLLLFSCLPPPLPRVTFSIFPLPISRSHFLCVSLSLPPSLSISLLLSVSPFLSLCPSLSGSLSLSFFFSLLLSLSLTSFLSLSLSSPLPLSAISCSRQRNTKSTSLAANRRQISLATKANRSDTPFCG